jgi:hypothetical protein
LGNLTPARYHLRVAGCSIHGHAAQHLGVVASREPFGASKVTSRYDPLEEQTCGRQITSNEQLLGAR